MAKLILVRGIPGSGKSTFAKQFKDCVHVESDQFCMQGEKFVWDATKHEANQKLCWNATKDNLMKGKDVVVAATFTTKDKIEPYIKLGKDCNANILIFRMTGEFKNVREVADTKIDKYKASMVDIDGEIRICPPKYQSERKIQK